MDPYHSSYHARLDTLTAQERWFQELQVVIKVSGANP
jgi:hypothetical protein